MIEQRPLNGGSRRRRLRALKAIAWVALASVAIAGCSKKKSSLHTAKSAALSPRPAPSAKALRKRPKTSSELPTTDADIYLGNLDGQIHELTRLVTEHPEITPNVERLSAARYLRGRFRGDLDEIQLAIDAASTCARLEPESPTCLFLRAEEEQSLHRFKEARADVARARELGGDPQRAAEIEIDLDWNDGLYDKAIVAIRKARRDRPSTATWTREAQLDHDLGLDDQADAAFEAAEDLIVDTAPLAVAHLDVQRGIQKVQQGLLDEACMFFREAVTRMPTYIAANEHLAEALHMLGRDDEATSIYEKVVSLSQDPEFSHALAELYAKRGRRDEARALEAKARAGYEALLNKYPEAMYWHASEFYMATGDAKKSLELLEKNVALRPNSASYVALSRAQLANRRASGARASIDKALAMPVRSASLFWTASLVYRSTGDAVKAHSFRDHAKRLNPRIEEDDPSAPAQKP